MLKDHLMFKKKKSKNLNIQYDQNKIYITFLSKLKVDTKSSKNNLLKKEPTNTNISRKEKLQSDKIYEAYKNIRPTNETRPLKAPTPTKKMLTSATSSPQISPFKITKNN
jgi:hypothetical protein